MLLTNYHGYATPYGTGGYCNSGSGPLTTVAGSGGPSGCATGWPNMPGEVGGSCAGYAKPSWQTVVGMPADGVRDLPDISLFAASGVWAHYYLTCFSDTSRQGRACTGAPSSWTGGGGTSFSSPIMAGVQALVNQKLGAPQGNPNPVYYALAAKEFGALGNALCNASNGNTVKKGCIFYDVTAGDMDVNCTGTVNCYTPSGTNGVLSQSSSAYLPAQTSGVGWDSATGLGSINAKNLVAAWAKRFR